MVFVSLNAFHNTRYFDKEGKAPISLRLIFRDSIGGKSKWIHRQYETGLRVTRKEYAQLAGARISEDLKEVKKDLAAVLAKAQGIVDGNQDLTIGIFESRFFGIATDTVNGCFEKIIADLKADNCIGTARANRTAINSFKSFVISPLLKKKEPAKDMDEDDKKAAAKKEKELIAFLMDSCEIRFSEITVDWLTAYERWVIKGGGAINSVGMHMRALRAVFNWAIKDGIIPASLYPFLKYNIRSELKYKIPSAEAELVTLKEYLPADPLQAEALDYWKFSYYCNGMNMMDIAGLRHSDIHDKDFILYDRSKTRRTKIQFKKIIIPIDHQILAIIKRRGAATLDPNGFVFPILEEDMSATAVKNKVQKWTAKINDGLRALSNKLELKKKITMVIARHNFANRLSNLGADGRMIQEQLGHQLAKTTESYRGTLYTDKIRKTREGL